MINTQELLIIIERTIIAIFVLFLITKLLGKKHLAQITLYDYIVGITIGSIAATSILDIDDQFLNGILSIITFGLSAILISYVSIKSKYIYNVLNGKPVILIENGEFVFENLRKTKMPIYKIIEHSRLSGYYDLSVINYAILETNGQISFLPKEEYQNSTTKDLKSNAKTLNKQTFCYNLIVDGSIQKDVLREIGKDKEWLKKELKKLKINSIKKIALLTIDQNKKIKVFKELI